MHDLTRYQFAEFSLDPERGLLRAGKADVSIHPQSLAVLRCLLRARGRTVSRHELFETAWPGVQVNDGSVRQAIWELRQQLAAAGSHLETVRGQGYRYAGPVSIAPAWPRVVDAAPGIVGRASELSCLHAALTSSVAGAGRTLVLSGAAGVGKSALGRALVRAAEERGGLCLEARGVRDEGAPPLWPWTSLLATYLRSLSEAQRVRLTREAPRVERLLRSDVSTPSSASGPPTQQRFLLFEELARVFIDIAERVPLLCLFVDDLHAADETSLGFLARLAREVAPRRIMLLVATRALPRAAHRVLARTLDDLYEQSQAEQLPVSNLPPEPLARLLAQHAPLVLTGELSRQLYELTQGNALFSLEVARLLGSSPVHERARALCAKNVELCTVLQRRLSGLSAGAIDALSAAAVWGEEFALHELAGTLERDAAEVLAWLDEARGSAFIHERVEHRYRFSHPLFHQTALQALGARSRAQLHLRAGTYLERQGPHVIEARSHELSHHFYEALSAQVAERAVRYCQLAAQRSHRATAYADAVALYGRALAALALCIEPEPSLQLWLLLEQAESARASAAPTHEVNARFAEIADAAAALGLSELQARAALGYAGQQSERFTPAHLGAGDDQTDQALLERALAALGSEHPKLRVLLLCSLAHLLVYAPERGPRERLSAEAAALARALDDPALLARVLSVQIALCSAPDCRERMLATCAELLALSERLRDRVLELETRVCRAVFLLSVCDRARAERDFMRADRLARALGTAEARNLAATRELVNALWEGRLDEVQRLSERAVQSTSDPFEERALYMARMAALHYLRGGDLRVGLTFKQTAIRLYPQLTAVRCGLASDYATLGQLDDARIEFDLALGTNGGPPASATWLGEMSGLADAASRLDDPLRALQIYDRLTPFADRCILFVRRGFLTGPVATFLGMLAATMRRFVCAEQWFDTARELCRRLGAPLFEQLNEYERARSLLLRAGPGDLAHVRQIAHAILRFVEQRPVGLLQARAAALLEQVAQRDQSMPVVRPIGLRKPAVRPRA
ncbi:MAG: transcriptional regulator [Myxococcaceae bacterium]|nr:transcriptional regulator [Myxococcaceae bacterium]